MSDIVENLILDLLEWVARKDRSYHETMDAWRTSCPRFPVWEDSKDRGLVELDSANGRRVVRVTTQGLTLLKEKRPNSHQYVPANRRFIRSLSGEETAATQSCAYEPPCTP